MRRKTETKISVDGGSDSFPNPFGELDLQGSTPSSATGNPTPDRLPTQQFSGRVEVRREKAGRGGKTVTTLRKLPQHLPLSVLAQLTFELKKTCACGGTLKERDIELQGDVCEKVMTQLTSRGFSPVRAGG